MHKITLNHSHGRRIDCKKEPFRGTCGRKGHGKGGGGNKRNRPNGTVGTELREETCNHRNNEKSASKPSLSLLDQATIMYEI